jgi:hypothetical protein
MLMLAPLADGVHWVFKFGYGKLREQMMLGRFVAAAALIALAGCAGFEPAGRNASRADLPPPAAAAPAPIRQSAPVAAAPQVYAPPPQTVQQAQVSPPVAAPLVAAPAPPPPPPVNNDDVTVTAPAHQIEPPRGDSRSVAERREDVQTWDRCILQVQQTYASDPLEPETETPEDICRRQLGQASRFAVPSSRLAPRR